MSAYPLGLATLPGLAVVAWLLLLAVTRTNTSGLSCGCGADWGNPKERHWLWWWEWLRMRGHDLAPRHRAWRQQQHRDDEGRSGARDGSWS